MPPAKPSAPRSLQTRLLGKDRSFQNGCSWESWSSSCSLPPARRPGDPGREVLLWGPHLGREPASPPRPRCPDRWLPSGSHGPWSGGGQKRTPSLITREEGPPRGRAARDEDGQEVPPSFRSRDGPAGPSPASKPGTAGGI